MFAVKVQRTRDRSGKNEKKSPDVCLGRVGVLGDQVFWLGVVVAVGWQ